MMKTVKCLVLYFISISVLACPSYLRKYEKDCQLSDRYNDVKERFARDFGVNIEYLTGYRAMRMISQKVWDKDVARIQCRPWEAYQPSPDVWSNWEKGAHFLTETLVNERLRGEPTAITLGKIQEINLNSVDVGIMSPIPAYIQGAEPGELRINAPAPPGFPMTCDDGGFTQESADMIRDDSYDIRDENDNPLVRIAGASPLVQCPGTNRWAGVILYSDSAVVESELNELMTFANEKIQAYLSDDQPEMSPIEFIADFQRWFVSIHPFGDGNGRTSRFLQDYLLAKFDLPFAPAGKLQNDVLVRRDTYRGLFADSMEETVAMLENCEGEYEQITATNRELKYANEELSCECRALYIEERPPVLPDTTVNYEHQNYRCGELDPLIPEDIQGFMFNVQWALMNTSLID